MLDSSSVYLTTSNLSKRYGEDVFQDLSLQIAEKEVIGLVGPSGCGKSTLLRLLAGLEDPTSGSIKIDGETPTKIREKHRIGIAFQEDSLLPWRTVEKNIALPFELAGESILEDRITNALAAMELNAYRFAIPSELSGGMRQRVSFARAVVRAPDLLLLDEPFAALDYVLRTKVHVYLRRLISQYHPTTILVTHDIEDAVKLTDRVFLMTGRPSTITEVVECGLKDESNNRKLVADIRNCLLGADSTLSC